MPAILLPLRDVCCAFHVTRAMRRDGMPLQSVKRGLEHCSSRVMLLAIDVRYPEGLAAAPQISRFVLKQIWEESRNIFGDDVDRNR